MRTIAFAVAVLVGCGGAVESGSTAATLPLECIPPAFEPSRCVDGTGGWRRCGAEDGTVWIFYPLEYLEGGHEHVDANGVRICRVWGNGARAPGDDERDF
jgi:hypothetical protein